MPEAPPLKEPLWWDYTLQRVNIPSAPKAPRKGRRIRNRKQAKRLRPGEVRCKDCGMHCTWERGRGGRYALMARGQWHWWNCPAQEKLRAVYEAKRDLAESFRDRIARD